MAIKQALAAAAISYGFEYATNYNPTIMRSAIAGLSGLADYYTKSMLLPSLNMKFDGYAAWAAGAAGGGASYAGVQYYIGNDLDMTSTFMRGAGYAIASDLVLSFLDSNFADNKAYSYFATTADGIGSKLSMIKYSPPSL